MNALGSALACWLVVVAAFDLASRRVPNWLAATGLVGSVFGLSTGLQPFAVSLACALLASLVIFGVFLAFYAAGLMGAGDVKFAAVLGLWFGCESLIQVFVLGSLIACLHAALALLLRSPGLALMLPKTSRATSAISDQDGARRRRIPYAAYLAIGGLAAFI